MRKYFGLALGVALPLTASADALEWLQKMSESVRQVTYEGTAVYRNGEQLESLRIFHRFADGQEAERMYTLSGQPREVLRSAESVTCILPEQRVVLEDAQGLHGLLPKLQRASFEKLQRHYDMIELARPARVAGRSCRNVHLQAKDIYRYHYQVCLDEDTALPLDIRLLSQRQELLEQVIFTDIKFPQSLSDKVFETGLDTSDYARLSPKPSRQAAISEEGVLWEIRDLPDGFRLVTRSAERWPGFDSPVTQLSYSDGLAAVSVFATLQQLPEDTLQGLTRMGAVNAYGRMLDQYHITVVGEVPQATVRFFGDNLHPLSLSANE